MYRRADEAACDAIHVLFSHYARLRYCSLLIVSISWLTRAGGDGSVDISLRQGGCERDDKNDFSVPHSVATNA